MKTFALRASCAGLLWASLAATPGGIAAAEDKALGRQEERQLEQLEQQWQRRLDDPFPGNDETAQNWIDFIGAVKKLPADERDAAVEHLLGLREAQQDLRRTLSEEQRSELITDINNHLNYFDENRIFDAAGVSRDDIYHGRPGGGSGGSPDSPGGGQQKPSNPWNPGGGLFEPSPVIHQGTAEGALGIGDYAGAIAAADKAIAMDPSYAAPHATKAQALYQLGKYADANQSAREALRLDPGNIQAQTAFRFTDGRQGPADSSRSPADPSKPMGTEFFKAPDTRTPTVRDLRGDAARLEAERLQAHTDRASRLFKQKDYAAALDAAEQALFIQQDSERARTYQIMSLLNLRRYGEALKAADEALRLSPKSSGLHTLRSQVHNRMGNYEKGLADARRAAELDPRSAGAFRNMAWALDGMGRREEALKALEEAALLDPGFRTLLEKAKTLKDGELALLLSGEAVPSQGALSASRPTSWRRIAAMSLSALLAGLLIGGAALRIMSKKEAQTLRAVPGSEASPEAARTASTGITGDGAGQTLGGSYQVVRQLGIGGMGIVYEALDTSLERRVAVKKMREEIRADPRERERFLKEARMVAALHHPNIVDIFAIVEDGNDAYLVFEYVDGTTLHEVLREGGKLSFHEALAVTEGVCGALDYAHGRDMIHRDLKPSNIMVDKERHIKVMDFGVARQAKDSLTRMSMTNTVVGTPPYMAPEQEQGVVCKGCDIYALAICIYEMVTGELPFSGVGAGMLLAKMNKTFVPPSRKTDGLPAGFDKVMDKAFEPDPKNRWQTAGEFLAMLKSLA